MNQQKIRQDIINHYGAGHQLAKVIEEQTELIHVIARRLQSGQWDKKALYEELADVYVMLDQLILIFTEEEAVSMHDFNKILQDEMQVKLKRTEQRMKQWKERFYCDISRENCGFCTPGPCGMRYEKVKKNE